MKKKIIAIATVLTVAAMIAGPGVVRALTESQISSILNLLESFGADTATIANVESALTGEPVTPVTPTGEVPVACVGITFDRHLSQGMSGDDVKCLQAVLNTDAETQLAESGVGSLGNETTYFGPLTKGAVISFQELYSEAVLEPWGLTSGTGYVGDTTIAKINEILAAVPPPVPTDCECTTWVDVACGGGDCSATEMQQTRTCTPATGAAADVCDDVTTTQCVADATCGVVEAGALGVALSNDTPVSVTIADGTALNETLKLDLTASSAGPVEVTSITITKSGISSNTDFSDFNVIDSDRVRHGNPISSLTADNTATIDMTINPVVIVAGTTESVTIRFNIDSSASGTIQLSIASASDIVSDATAVSGTFPINGNIMTVVDGSGSVATVVLEKMAITGVSTSAELNVDLDSAQEIAKFSVNETSSNEKVKIERLTLYNNGNATDVDYKDVELVAQDGTILATAQPSGQYTTFDLTASPYEIGKGIIRYLTIRAKIINGATRTIQFVVYNDYDLEVKGLSTGAYILATTTSGGTGGSGTAFPVGNMTNYNKITIGSGSITFSKSSDSPSAGVAAGEQSIVLAKYDITPNGEDMELREMTLGIDYVTLDLTGTVFVKYNDATVWSGAYSTTSLTNASYVSGTSTPATLSLSSYPTMTASETGTITVVVSISSSATSSDEYKAYLDITQVKRKITNDLWDPSAAETVGNTVAVKGLNLTVATLSIPPTQSVVTGTDNFEFARFDLDASNSGEDIRVSTIIVTATKSGTGAVYTDVNNLRLYNADAPNTALLTSSSTNTVAAANTFTLSSPIIVSRDEVIHLILKGNVVTKTASNTETFLFAVNGSGNITSTGAETGNTFSEITSGTGQTMTIVESGSLLITLLSGTGKSPVVNQTVTLGTQDMIVFAFKLTSLYEAQKITSLKLMATGSGLKTTDLRNIEIYAESSDGTPEATPFATASELTCASNSCYYTWTAADNLLPEAVQVSSPANFYVKADVTGEGVVTLGDDFAFMITAPSSDIGCKGAYTGSAGTVSTTAQIIAGGRSRIVPFSVVVEGTYPTESSTSISLGANTTLGRFKVTNNGSAKLTLTNVKFTDNGSSTGTVEIYKLYMSDENSANYTGTEIDDSDTNTNSVDFGTLNPATEFTLNGGAYRYLTARISTVASLVSGDFFNLSIGSIGDLKYKVSESDLGYDGDYDQLFGTITGLYVSGTPTVGTLTKE